MKVLCLLALLCFAYYVQAQSEKVFIAQLTSEGARSPLGENIFNGRFPYGSGEVTSMGLRQHYLVGYDLAINYADPLGLDKVYSPWQVNIRSTNHNFTLMGAQAELEAIWPPSTRSGLRPEQATLAVPPGDNTIIETDIAALGNDIMPLNFQTLPIHAMDFDKDTVLMSEWCHRITEINNKTVMEDAKFISDISTKYSVALDVFRSFIKDDQMTIHQIYSYMDTLNSTIFNLDSVGTLQNQREQLLAFGFEYLEKYWSNAESRRIFTNGFLLDLERYIRYFKL